jgi:flagellar FliJ protein
MKKFRFRLETVLKLRQMAEDQQKRVVGELLSEIHRRQEEAVTLDSALRGAGAELKERNGEGQIDLRWLGHYQSYVSHVRSCIAEIIESVAELQQKVAEARAELAEAAKQTRIIEKLKERRKQRYDDDLTRAEMREQDEVATKNFLRSRYSA